MTKPKYYIDGNYVPILESTRANAPGTVQFMFYSIRLMYYIRRLFWRIKTSARFFLFCYCFSGSQVTANLNLGLFPFFLFFSTECDNLAANQITADLGLPISIE